MSSQSPSKPEVEPSRDALESEGKESADALVEVNPDDEPEPSPMELEEKDDSEESPIPPRPSLRLVDFAQTSIAKEWGEFVFSQSCGSLVPASLRTPAEWAPMIVEFGCGATRAR
jgi:hypothetical protein